MNRMVLVLTGAVMATLSVAAGAQMLTVPTAQSGNGSITYLYTYTFGITGPTNTAVTDIFLTSDDLSPLDVVVTKNHAVSPAWSWLGVDTPSNFLDFTSLDANGNPLDVLHSGDELEVNFSDAGNLFAPKNIGTATAFDSTTSSYLSVNARVSVTAVPEPDALSLLTGTLVLGPLLLWRGARRRKK